MPVRPAVSAIEEDVVSALVNLGYQRTLVERALSKAGSNGGAKSFDVLFRDVLASVSK